MAGGAGNDTYSVDNDGDVVIENAAKERTRSTAPSTSTWLAIRSNG
jgi:hypothetical protein